MNKVGTYLGMAMGMASMARDVFYPNKSSKKQRDVYVDVRTEPKVGRNEPCPCGSGLKYKRCGAIDKCSN